MDKKKETDALRLIFNVSAISLTIMAVMFAIKPYLDVNNPRLPEIKLVEQNLVYLKAKDLPPLIRREAGHKPVMLVFYASWCGPCHVMMPRVMELIRGHKLDFVEPVFVAVDDQPRELSKYLVENNYYEIYPPYFFDQTVAERLSQAISGSGSTFKGNIPYVGFFNNDGKLVAESPGLVDKRELLRAAEKLKP